MGWNHRILAHEQEGEVFFSIHEVYYDKEGTPNAYTTNAVGVAGDSIKEIKTTLNRMKKCLEKPILTAGKDFPKIYTKVVDR